MNEVQQLFSDEKRTNDKRSYSKHVDTAMLYERVLFPGLGYVA